jgi:hypothetical protein
MRGRLVVQLGVELSLRMKKVVTALLNVYLFGESDKSGE